MALELFHFTGNDGTKFTLPKVIKSGVLRKARNARDDVDYAYNVIELVADGPALDALDEMTAKEVADIFKDWMQGMQPGESSASSAS
ncbi:hypothetical protein E3T43_07120 [Cryobacterium sp. Hh7]|uniref:hypothetical protein n=1 Tax=Cryobacterium sp. Hh7 TaxID=1259159 RepID=UPI0010698CE9|nr:hypothetical protein [Cryobacterium sp. Hh7]TFD58013.1 hypothetical protein E3T43_07120 [Cryobacterium sp. Hh7]